jgi:8-oxo-dGTP pyrophosphatase MutT (NUDIX family)
MSISNGQLRELTSRYLARFPDERENLVPLLLAVERTGDLTSRSELRGHVTCGAVLLDDRWRVLHVEHRALGQLLLPGGHVEPGDDSLFGAALRELREETGIRADGLVSPTPYESAPLDVDVHFIPANRTKGEPAHRHFDFRHLFRGSQVPLRLQGAEVTGARWLPLEAMAQGRLAQKLRDLRRVAGA